MDGRLAFLSNETLSSSWKPNHHNTYSRIFDLDSGPISVSHISDHGCKIFGRSAGMNETSSEQLKDKRQLEGEPNR